MSAKQSLVALIPARGGSKRLPGKNTRCFFGHPLLAYTIAAARNCGLFEHVLVSTEDPEIGRTAEWYGAEFLERPASLATDTAELVDVAIHALDTLNAQNRPVDAFCQLMPNCPLRRAADISEHYERFDRDKRAFQISVVDYRGVYPQWALTADPTGRGAWLFGREHLVRSQNLAKACCPTGAIWWVRTADFLEQRSFYGDPFHLEPIDADRGIDIDRSDEWKMAELLTHGLWRRDGASPLEPVAQAPFAAEVLV